MLKIQDLGLGAVNLERRLSVTSIDGPQAHFLRHISNGCNQICFVSLSKPLILIA